MIENSIVFRDFKGKYDYLSLDRAEGSTIWDRSGNQYIDFSSGWNVTNLGWNHPEVKEAIIKQASKNVQGLLWGSDPIQEAYAEALTAALPTQLDACAKATGGTEAVEMAIKVARTHARRKRVIGFRGSYHGQLFASLALGGSDEDRPALAPLVPEIQSLPLPHAALSIEEYEKCIAQIDSELASEEVAAIVIEPVMITGSGSAQLLYPGLLSKLRSLADRYGTLLIVDEVGTGFSRTGKLFGIEHEGVVPDMLVLAKGISNGAAALGTVVGKSAIFESAFAEAMLISTFGWTPLACAVALKTLEIHQRDRVWEIAAKHGEYLQAELAKLVGEHVSAVRGVGMEIGLELQTAERAQHVRQSALERGLYLVVGADNLIQLMPPLTTSRVQLDAGLAILRELLQ